VIINEGVLVRIKGDASNLMSSLKGGRLAVGGFATAAAAAFTAVAAASVKMAAQLDRDLRLVATLGGEAADNTGRLRSEVLALGREFGRSFNELARANYQAVSGGFKSIADSMELTRAGTKLAVAGNADLVGSTEAVVKWLKAFSDEALSAEDAAAQLWGITRDGIVTVEALTKFLSDLPSSMASSGIASHELGAALSTMTGQTGNASRAVDQLRGIIIRMEKEAITGSFVERVERFANQGMGELEKTFGETNAAGMDLLIKNLGKLRTNTEAAQDVTEDFTSAVEGMGDSAELAAQRISQSLESAMTSFGDYLIETFNPELQDTADFLDRVASGVERLRTRAEIGNLFSDEELLAMDRFRDDSGNLLPRFRDTSFFGTEEPRFDQMRGIVVRDFETTVEAAHRTGAEFTYGEIKAAFIDGSREAGIELFETLERRATQQRIDEARANLQPSTQGQPQFIIDRARLRGEFRDDVNESFAPTQPPSVGLPPRNTPPAPRPRGRNEFDFDSLADSTQEFNRSAQLASATAGILASSIGGLLVSAFGQADSAVGRFVQGLLVQFAQLGVQIGVSALIPGQQFFGFAAGGFTGGAPGQPRGIVHGNEFVFNDKAVSALGLGRLERMHQAAQAGNTSNTVNVTVNAGSGDATQIAGITADAVGAKMRELQTTNRGSLYAAAPQKYRR